LVGNLAEIKTVGQATNYENKNTQLDVFALWKVPWTFPRFY
jgi:hypothetical protein